MKITIFLGPSLPIEEARLLVPSAHFRPPAAQGDLLSAVDEDGADVLGLIDGTFHQSLSVWHSEVCYLLSRGVAIYGASSMGALRAVETAKFGMIGVGAIYRWYRDGVITADDEVALCHGDEFTDFRPLSVPLVNIRASIDRAIAEGYMDRVHGDLLISVARSIYYPERLVPLILQACREAGFPNGQLDAAERALTVGYVDQKRTDARELLETMAGILNGSIQVAKPSPFEFTRSSVFDTLYNLDRKVRVAGRSISLQSIAEHLALYCSEFQDIRRRAFDRALVVFLGLLLNVQPGEEEIEDERNMFCADRGLSSPELLREWLQSNAFSERDLDDYLAQEAICRRLRRSELTTRSLDRGCKALLDELRMRGTFPYWASEASEAAGITAAYSQQPEYHHLQSEHPGQLAEAHALAGNPRITGDARIWAEDAGFDGVEGLTDALRRAAVTNDVRNRISRQVEALEHVADALLAGAGDAPAGVVSEKSI